MQQIKKRPSFAKIQEFGAAIRKIEKDYFKEGTTQEIAKTGDWRLWHKAIILPVVFVIIYSTLVFFGYQNWLGIILCVLLGITAAAIGFNIGHDANHGSFSENETINKPAKLSFNFLGVVSLFWRFKHNTLHHTYTNLVGLDEDVSGGPGLRMHNVQPWKPINRLQPFYCWFLYGMLYIGWVWINDFQKYYQGHIEGHKIKMTKNDRLVFWATKSSHLIFLCILPSIMVGWEQWLIGYFIYAFSVGLFIAVVFQMAHIVEKVEQPTISVATQEEWIVHEIATTANFAIDNKILSWFVGGLNFQIEHHLFPKVSHIYYRDLSYKVIEVCKRFGVEYHVYPTFWSVFRSHIRKMIYLSKKP